MAWLSGYSYRKKCTVVATTAGAQTNYQLELVVGESSGAAGEDVDCESHCQDFPNDIQFTKEDGETKHDYWIDVSSLEGTTPNRKVNVFIEVASIPASGFVDFYMYYGKSGDSGESNGDNTFEFFDDFVGVEELERISYNTLWSGSGSEDWLGRPVLVDNSGTWIVVYRQSDVHPFDLTAKMHIRFSTDEGENWTAADTFTNSNPVTGFPIQGHSPGAVTDPLVIKAPNGDLLVHVLERRSGSRNGTYQYRSTNNGASWTDEGQINSDIILHGGQDHVIVGSVIYAVFWKDPGNDILPPNYSVLYKSINNGTTWTHVSDITSGSEGTNEASIEYLGDSTFISVLRDDYNAKTYQRKSTDMGLTWGSLIDKTAQLSVLQRPRMRIFSDESDRVYLYGRDDGANEYTVIYYSDDNGDNWEGKFYPDPSSYADTGCCDVLKKTNGDFYMLSYAGTFDVANIKEYIFEKGWTIDTAKWDTEGTPIISDSVLSLDANDKILGKTAFGFQYALEASAKANEQDVDVIGLNDTLPGSNKLLMTNSDHSSGCNVDNFDCFGCTTVKDGEIDNDIVDGLWDDFRNIYYTYRIKRYSGTHTKFEQSGNSYTDPDNVHVPIVNLKPYFRVWNSSQESTLDLDWVFVRKYVDPEPTWGSWGAESKSTGRSHGYILC